MAGHGGSRRSLNGRQRAEENISRGRGRLLLSSWSRRSCCGRRYGGRGRSRGRSRSLNGARGADRSRGRGRRSFPQIPTDILLRGNPHTLCSSY